MSSLICRHGCRFQLIWSSASNLALSCPLSSSSWASHCAAWLQARSRRSPYYPLLLSRANSSQLFILGRVPFFSRLIRGVMPASSCLAYLRVVFTLRLIPVATCSPSPFIGTVVQSNHFDSVSCTVPTAYPPSDRAPSPMDLVPSRHTSCAGFPFNVALTRCTEYKTPRIPVNLLVLRTCKFYHYSTYS